MSRPPVVVMGGGVAGLSASLLLARAGHAVTLIEQDDVLATTADQSLQWRRPGIPHFQQPHAFIPRGRTELRRHLPDVYEALLSAGAWDVDLRRKLPGEAVEQDEELQYVGVRRPLIEWALRQAVLEEPGITVHAGSRVEGVTTERERVTGVRVDGQVLPGGLVVDALGRRTTTAAWADSSDCGVVYYSRYFRVRDGAELPDGPWLLGPRGDLGYFGYSTFPGDNRTFAALLAVPPRMPEWRLLKEERAWSAAVDLIPALRQWVDPALVEPVTDVLPMAGLRNTLRAYDPAAAVGLFPVGDAYCHTDPVLAHGLAFSLVHGAALVAAIEEHGDLLDAGSAYAAETGAALRERYALATALDSQRLRMWQGEPVDVSSPDGDYALFSMVAAGAAAQVDADVFRVFVRRIGLLDSTEVLDRDLSMQRRIEEVFRDLRSRPRPAPGPSREAMAAAIASA